MKLNVAHAGGLGKNIGPAGAILALGADVNLTIIEANIGGREWSGYQRRATEFAQAAGLGSCKFVLAAVGRQGKDRPFYQNGDPRCSSLFPINPRAAILQRVGGSSPLVWGDAAETARVDRMDVTTLDLLLDEGQIQQPDVLSMDIQGAELDALVGAEWVLEKTLCVVTEVENYEMYRGQGLGGEIARLLYEAGFFYVGNATEEQWFPSRYMLGRGVYAVAEAIFLKDYRHVTNFHQLIALALAANAFECHWATMEATDKALMMWPERSQNLLGGISPSARTLLKARTWIEKEWRG